MCVSYSGGESEKNVSILKEAKGEEKTGRMAKMKKKLLSTKRERERIMDQEYGK